MAATSTIEARLQAKLTPDALRSIRELWFQQFDRDEHFIVPDQAGMKQWFMKNEEFDQSCMKRFGPILETIKESGATATDIIAAAKPSSALDWLSLILLLDQISRNSYRGSASKVVFEVFDPLAQGIALRAIDDGIPSQDPLVRYRLAYRFWFLMPLMHSEDLAIHDTAIKEFEKLSTDVKELVDTGPDSVSRKDTDELKCQAVLTQNIQGAKGLCNTLIDFEKKHQVIIAQFGRYPHRNEALGRTPTKEEEEYLESGGETFTQ